MQKSACSTPRRLENHTGTRRRHGLPRHLGLMRPNGRATIGHRALACRGVVSSSEGGVRAACQGSDREATIPARVHVYRTSIRSDIATNLKPLSPQRSRHSVHKAAVPLFSKLFKQPPRPPNSPKALQSVPESADCHTSTPTGEQQNKQHHAVSWQARAGLSSW